MERFIRRENIKHFQEMLERTTDESERKRIQRLLDEELLRLKAAADDESKSMRG
jgi:hypothetical protein